MVIIIKLMIMIPTIAGYTILLVESWSDCLAPLLSALEWSVFFTIKDVVLAGLSVVTQYVGMGSN